MNNPIKRLRNGLLGGFFAAHDEQGLHADWFMAMFLDHGFSVSVPYVCCECWQHEGKDPDMVWPLLESAYREARVPFDAEDMKLKMRSLMGQKLKEYGGNLTLPELARRFMREMESLTPMAPAPTLP